MDMLAILEVAIGIVLVYLILSLVCTSLLEVWIGMTGLKKNNLRSAVERLLGDSDLADRVYADPEVVALCGPKGQLPSYIPTDVFARSVLSVATDGEWRKAGGLPTVLRDKFVELASGGNGDKGETSKQKLGRKFVEFIDEAGGDMELFQNKIELWFDRTNDRSKGWFKRKVNRRLVLLGFLIALAVNADTISIFQRLADDPGLRAAAVEMAEEKITDTDIAAEANAEDGPMLAAIRKQVGEVAPFIGWSVQDPFISAWQNDVSNDAFVRGLVKAIGLLLTAFAVSLGAPFWFDLLQKLVSIRKSVAAKKAEDMTTGKSGEAPPGTADAESVAAGAGREPAYSGPMAGFVPTAANVNLGNAYWLAKAAQLSYETDSAKVLATIESWGLRGNVFESGDPQVQKYWKASIGTVDTQGFVAADDNAILVCFRGTEPTRPADIVTDLKYKLVAAGDYGAGQVHEGFKAAIDAVWGEVAAKVAELADKRQPVWFAGHSLGGALAVLAASRYEQIVESENKDAKIALDKAEAAMEPDKHDDATLIGERQKALARLRGRVAGTYTIGQPRVGDEAFVKDFSSRLGQSHVRVINNRDVVPRVPLRAMDYRHSGTVLYLDEFGRLHRDPGLWLRLLDTVVISKAEMAKAKEGGQDHNSAAYVDLLDKARKSTSALTRLAVS